MKKLFKKSLLLPLAVLMAIGFIGMGCSSNGEFGSSSDAAEKVYVAPGEHDEFYGFFRWV